MLWRCTYAFSISQSEENQPTALHNDPHQLRLQRKDRLGLLSQMRMRITAGEGSVTLRNMTTMSSFYSLSMQLSRKLMKTLSGSWLP